MAIEDLIGAIGRDTRARIERIAADTDARISALRNDAARAEAAARTSAAEAVARAHAAQGDAALGVIEQEARDRRLRARARVLDRVRRAAEGVAADADADPAWRVWLPALLGAARRAAGDGALVVRCRPSALAFLRAEAPGADLRPDLDRAGLRIESDGLLIDGTLGTWLAQAFPRLARRVLDAVEAT